MNEYLGEQALKVIVSPGRAGYLVPEGDQAAFQQAVAIASSRWTGVTEPILSLQADGSLAPADVEIARALDLVALVTVGCPSTPNSDRIPQLDLPVIASGRLDRAIELRSLPWHVGASAAAEGMAARPNAPLWEKVAVGIDSPDGRARPAPTEDSAGIAGLGSGSMLEVGLAGLKESDVSDAFSGPILLWITEPDSLPDCQAFWNFRTLRGLRWPRSPVYLLPERALRDWRGMEEMLRQMIRERQFSGKPDVVINSLSVADARLRELGEQLGLAFEASKELSIPWAAAPVGDNVRSEFFFTTDVDPLEWLLNERILGYEEWFKVQAFRQGTAVPVAPESLRNVLNGHAGVPLRLRLSGGFLHDLPHTPSTARAVLDTAVWSGPYIQSIVAISTNGQLNISAPSPADALPLLVRDVAGQVELSDKGRLAASLLERQAVSVLTDVSSHAAMSALTTRQSKQLVKELSRVKTPLPEKREDSTSRENRRPGVQPGRTGGAELPKCSHPRSPWPGGRGGRQCPRAVGR